MAPMNRPIEVTVGRRIRRRRWMIGMTREELGARLGVTARMVEDYESGQAPLGVAEIWEVAHALGTSVGYLFEEDPIDGAAAEDVDVEEFTRQFAALPLQLRPRLLKLMASLAQQH
jgi:transcriptional regulator with XRE-family HTH domain